MLHSIVITAFASHQKQGDFPLHRAPAQNGLCIHDVIFQRVTAHLEDVSASVRATARFQHMHDIAQVHILIAYLCF